MTSGNAWCQNSALRTFVFPHVAGRSIRLVFSEAACRGQCCDRDPLPQTALVTALGQPFRAIELPVLAGHCRSVAQSLSDRPRPRNLTILAAAVSSGGKGVFSHRCPAATRAQYPRSGVGIFARRHALARPTSDMPNRFDRVRVDSDQTSLYSASRVKVQSGLRLSGGFAEGMGACSSVFEDIAVTRDANSTTFLPCLSSALCRSFV